MSARTYRGWCAASCPERFAFRGPCGGSAALAVGRVVTLSVGDRPGRRRSMSVYSSEPDMVRGRRAYFERARSGVQRVLMASRPCGWGPCGRTTPSAQVAPGHGSLAMRNPAANLRRLGANGSPFGKRDCAREPTMRLPSMAWSSGTRPQVGCGQGSSSHLKLRMQLPRWPRLKGGRVR